MVRPGIATFSTSVRPPLFAIELEDVNVVALGVADIDEGGGLRGGHDEGSGERGGAEEDGGTRCGTWHGLPPGNASVPRDRVS